MGRGGGGETNDLWRTGLRCGKDVLALAVARRQAFDGEELAGEIRNFQKIRQPSGGGGKLWYFFRSRDFDCKAAETWGLSKNEYRIGVPRGTLSVELLVVDMFHVEQRRERAVIWIAGRGRADGLCFQAQRGYFAKQTMKGRFPGGRGARR